MNETLATKREREPGKVAFFPRPLPDELLLSTIARFSSLSALSHFKTNEILFGTRSAQFSYDLPARLPHLAAAIGRPDVDTLLLNHTLFPFYTALFDGERRVQVRQAMSDNKPVSWMTRGGTSLVPRPQFLRFCPKCDIENEKIFGSRFWQRVHQLPTSLVCSKHQEILYASSVSTSTVHHRYELLDRPLHQDRPLLRGVESEGLNYLGSLADEGQHLLGSGPEFSLAYSPSLRSLAFEAGYAEAYRSNRLDQARLQADFLSDNTLVLQLWPWLRRRSGQAQRLEWTIWHLVSSKKVSRVSFTYAILKAFLQRRIRKEPRITTVVEVCDFHSECSVLENRRALSQSGYELKQRLQETAEQILAECPPIRVTMAELFRRDPTLELAKRMKNDCFSTFVKEICESTKDFHRRRLKFILTTPGGSEITDRELCLIFGIKDRCALEVLKTDVDEARQPRRIS